VIQVARILVVSHDRPAGLLPMGKVPWKGPVPAPGASNAVKAPCLFSQKAVIHITLHRR